MPYLRQTNFLGGELDPLLHGRTDLEVFGSGLRTCKNFIISQHGAAISRPGTELCGFTYIAGRKVRLIPFEVSATQTMLLEVGHQYLRGWLDGEQSTARLTTVVKEEELETLKWAQFGSELVFVHPNHAPFRVTIDSTLFSFTVAPLDYGPSVINYSVGLDQIVRTSWVLDDPTYGGVDSIFAEGTTHPSREWIWKHTNIVKDTNGITYETNAVQVGAVDAAGTLLSLPNNNVVLYPDRKVKLKRSADAGPNPYTALGLTYVSTNWFRGRGKLFGFVGSTSSDEFVDVGEEPNYLVQPPEGTNPFSGTTADNPTSVAAFQARRCFGGTVRRPRSIITSAVDSYDDYDPHLLPVAGQALELELASRRMETIKHLLPLKKLLVFTSSSEWGVDGGDGQAMDFDNVRAQVIEENGSSDVPPIIADGCAVFLKKSQRSVRAFIPTADSDGFSGADISTVAQHLLLGSEPVNDQSLVSGKSHKIVDWCYAAEPYGIIWAVREDGVLLSCTFQASGRAAWARHETAGYVKAVAAVRENGEDRVYIAVQRDGEPRDGGILIERMFSRLQVDDVSGGASLDSATEIEFQTSDIGEGYYSAMSHMPPGTEVYLTARGNPVFGPYTVDENGEVYVPAISGLVGNTGIEEGTLGFVQAFMGLKYTCDLETLDVAQGDARTRQKTVTSVGFEVDNSRGLYVGQDFEHLVEWRQRTVSNSYNSPGVATELVTTNVRSTWDKNGRAVLRQTLPLPVTVVGITREVEIGG